MSLGNLHNPKAAADLIADFRKKFSAKVCLAPHSDHSGQIVAAHTLSVEAVLRPLSTDSHVYAANLKGKFSPDSHPIEIRRLGLRDVSVFNGFCSKHDAELFSCLENEPFRFKREQSFMLAFRAAARECYLKRKQCESYPDPDTVRLIHGIDEQLEYSELALISQAASLRGAEEAEAFKSKLDRYLLQKTWDRLITRAIIFPKIPSIVASFVFEPFHDMNGEQLQDYENLEAEMSQLAISLIPIEQGGAAIFSWLDTANTAPRKFFESVAQGKNLTSSIIHAAIDNSENFAFSSAWYESLSDEQKHYLFSRISSLGASIVYHENGRADSTAPFLDDWGQPSISSF